MHETYFDQRAATWDSNPNRLELAQAIMNCINNRIPLRADFSVLDYGCGTGLLSVLLASRVKSVTSADTSQEMLAQLQNKLTGNKISNIRAVVFDIIKPQRQCTVYDLVASSMTLHHLPDATRGITELCKLAKPGGWLTLADLFSEDGSFHSDVPVKYNGFDPEGLSTLIGNLGFQNVTFEFVYEIPRNNRTYPVFCICAQNKS
jgi:2-polyprenyl-3-methyl-5-hydroxy-6-metoxy-1,4-benzoquinol methylase